jgi:hypothetical protein
MPDPSEIARLVDLVENAIALLCYTAGPNTRAAIRDALEPLTSALAAERERGERMEGALREIEALFGFEYPVPLQAEAIARAALLSPTASGEGE